jgi:hypothetical protein
MAVYAAAQLKNGRKVFIASAGPDGKMRCDPVVCVPGFDDGTQLPAPAAPPEDHLK